MHPSLEENTSPLGFTLSYSLNMWLDHFYYIVVLDYLVVILVFLKLNLRKHMRNYKGRDASLI